MSDGSVQHGFPSLHFLEGGRSHIDAILCPTVPFGILYVPVGGSIEIQFSDSFEQGSVQQIQFGLTSSVRCALSNCWGSKHMVVRFFDSFGGCLHRQGLNSVHPFLLGGGYLAQRFGLPFFWGAGSVCLDSTYHRISFITILIPHDFSCNSLTAAIVL